MGRNQYWAWRVYDLCIYYMTGTPEGSTESGFMEKPGIEPATPGLQGIAFIHYTTGASHGADPYDKKRTSHAVSSLSALFYYLLLWVLYCLNFNIKWAFKIKQTRPT